MNAFVQLLQDDNGATMTEYALILALVAVVAMVAVAAVGQNTSTVLFQRVADAL